MREDVLLAVSEMQLVVKAVRVIRSVLSHVLYDDGCFAAKICKVAIFLDDN